MAHHGGFRFPIESRLAERVFEKFHLDVGCGDIYLEPFDLLAGKGWLDFCGIPKPVFTTISCEQQCAEKIYAYTLPREGGFNSRVKDLVDIILLIRLKDFDSERFRQTLDMTFARRDTHSLPHVFAEIGTRVSIPELCSQSAAQLTARSGLTGEFQKIFIKKRSKNWCVLRDEKAYIDARNTNIKSLKTSILRLPLASN